MGMKKDRKFFKCVIKKLRSEYMSWVRIPVEEQGKPLVKGAQNLIVKRAGSLLAVTRNKRYGVAVVYKLYGIFNPKRF